MKVKEAIEELSKLPPEAEIIVDVNSGGEYKLISFDFFENYKRKNSVYVGLDEFNWNSCISNY